MSVVAIDYHEMAEAAPRVTELHVELAGTAALLGGLNVGGVEMPPGVKGRVMAQVNAARADVQRGARGVEGLGAELARRAKLARLADTLDRIWMATKPLAFKLSVIAEYNRLSARRLAGEGRLDLARQHRRHQLRLERGVRGFGAADKVFGLVAPTVADFLNPNLSTDQKFGRAAGRGGTATAVGGASKAATSATVRGVSALAPRLAAFSAGGAVGLGVGVAWTMLDYKFNLSPKIADGATWAVDKVGDGAQAFDDNVLDPVGDKAGDLAGGAADGADKATPWDGVAPW